MQNEFKQLKMSPTVGVLKLLTTISGKRVFSSWRI